MKLLAVALATLLSTPGLALARGSEGAARGERAEAKADPASRPRGASDRRIDLDFKNADIRDILGILADVGGVVIVPSARVKARVSIRMRSAPWEKALEVLARKNGLAYDRTDKVIRVRKAR